MEIGKTRIEIDFFMVNTRKLLTSTETQFILLKKYYEKYFNCRIINFYTNNLMAECIKENILRKLEHTLVSR